MDKKRLLEADDCRLMQFDCNCTDCIKYKQLPYKISVKYATQEEVNGEYYLTETPYNLARYTKDGVWEDKYHQFCIGSFRSKKVTEVRWRIVANPAKCMHRFHCATSVTLYKFPSQEKDLPLPPRRGWIPINGSSADGTRVTYYYSDRLMDTNGSNKKSRLGELLEDRFFHPRIESLESYIPRLQTIVNPADQDTIYASMFRFVFSNHCERKKGIQNIEKAFQVALQKERYSALELAIWKALCWMYYPHNTDAYALLNWWTTGWKKMKSEMRKSRDINIIMQHVVAFEKPSIRAVRKLWV